MSSISPQEIKQEFLKSKMGIAGITILSILIVTSIIAIIAIPLETFQEWNNPRSLDFISKGCNSNLGEPLYDRKNSRT